MTLAAAGGYLRALRKARGLSQKNVARMIGLASYNQIQRWEAGTAEASAFNLAAYAAVVGADPAVLQRLLLDADATADDGAQIAALRLALEKYNL